VEAGTEATQAASGNRWTTESIRGRPSAGSQWWEVTCARPADHGPETKVGRESLEPNVFAGGESRPKPLGEGS